MNTECLFCKFIHKELMTEYILESKTCIVIKDIAPRAKIHYLIIPKIHCSNFNTLSTQDIAQLQGIVETTQQLSLIDHNHHNYRLIINNGGAAGQSIFHLHIHFLSGQILTDF